MEGEENRKVVSWKEYLDSRLADLEKEMQLHVRYSEQALSIAKDAADKRNTAENFIREQLREQAGTFVAARVFEVTVEPIEKRLSELEKVNANYQGRLWAIGAVFIVLQLVMRFWLK